MSKTVFFVMILLDCALLAVLICWSAVSRQPPVLAQAPAVLAQARATRVDPGQIAWPASATNGVEITPALLDILNRIYAYQYVPAPASSTAYCTYGQVAVDDAYYYLCVPNHRYHEEGQPLYRWIRIPVTNW